MANTNDLILDPYSGLSHKSSLTTTPLGQNWVAPTWVGTDHDRRLKAYNILEAVYRNVGREYLNVTSEAERANRREFGDAALLVKVVVAALIGDSPEIVVDEADDEGNTAAQDRQEWLRDVLGPQGERLITKMLETERNAVKLGDGLYVLGWSSKKNRVRVRVFDPGSYFPVLDANAEEDEYPSTIHIAWEFERKEGTETRRYVRRMTWSLRDIESQFNEETNEFGLREGDRIEAGSPSRIVRDLPWNDEPATQTCYWSDGTWEIKEMEGRTLDDLSDERAEWATNEDGETIRNLDLGIDFIPVIHIPNTVSILEHFGESILTAVTQLLDELSAVDTDLSKASSLAAVPAVALSGARVEGSFKVAPGAAFNLGQNGKMDVIDLSQTLPALQQEIEFLLKRLSVNARVPEEVLGRVNSAEAASGIALALSFGPLRGFITEARLVREEKYPLLLKFVQRFALLFDEIQGDVMDARVEFGSYLPSDRAALIKEVTDLSKGPKPLISRQSALRLLEAGGIDLRAVEDELAEVESEDFEQAMLLLEATGDEDALFEYLGRKPPEEPAAVAAPPPPGPGGVPTFQLDNPLATGTPPAPPATENE